MQIILIILFLVIISVSAQTYQLNNGKLYLVNSPPSVGVTNIIPWVGTSNRMEYTNALTYTGDGTLTVSSITVNSLTLSSNRWDDSMVPAMAFKTGSTAPSFGAFGPSGNLLIYLFAGSATDDQAYGTVQMPHRWDEGTPIYPHVHWARTAAPSNPAYTNVVWGLEYSFQTINSAFLAPSTILLTNGVADVDWTHQISAFTNIVTTGAKISSIMVLRLYRPASSNASDTYDRAVALLGFDLHYMVNGFGSRLETSK